MSPFRFLVLFFISLVAAQMDPSAWASAASSVAASIRNSISAEASRAMVTSLSAVIPLPTANLSTPVTSKTASPSPYMTGTASLVSGSPSVIANRTRFSINTSPLSTSNVTVYTSFLPQATVGAAAVNDAQYAAILGGGALAAIFNMLL